MPEYCVVRQRAGPLVKTYTTDRLRYVLRAGQREAVPYKSPAMWCSSADKLELYLALFGYAGSHYVLTYDDAHLPGCFADVRKSLTAFIKRVHRAAPQCRRYVYAIEVGHSRGRWHLHFVADGTELPLDLVRELWRGGFVNPGGGEWPVLHPQGGYRRLARYICKDRDGGFVPLGKHKWGVARGMRAMIPPPEIKLTQRRPAMPREVFWASTQAREHVDAVSGKSYGKFFRADWVTLPKQCHESDIGIKY